MKETVFTFAATVVFLAGACSSDDDPQVASPKSAAGTGNTGTAGASSTGGMAANEMGMAGSHAGAEILPMGGGSDQAGMGVTPGNVAGAASGSGSSQPTATGGLRSYDVVLTFREPMTQPNDTIFIGAFTYDPTAGVVSNLVGAITQSMTKVNGVYGSPMTTVSLEHQLSSVAVNLGGVEGRLVTSFALETTDTFTGGSFAPGGTQYYGLQEGTPNNHNAYVTIFVNTREPTAALDQSQLDKLAYADCTAGGMMMSSCMTGTTAAGYGRTGTMGGYPVSQVVTGR